MLAAASAISIPQTADAAAEMTLLMRAQQGDQGAFEALVKPYLQKLYNLAYRMLGKQEDAEEVSQDALLRAWAKLPHFRRDSSFSTWLFAIANNSCLDTLRRRKRTQGVVSLDAEDEAFHRNLADERGVTPEQHLSRDELHTKVRQAIGRLPDEFRSVLVLYDMQGASYAEIADILGIQLGTVKSRLNRARFLLKAYLAPYVNT